MYVNPPSLRGRIAVHVAVIDRHTPPVGALDKDPPACAYQLEGCITPRDVEALERHAAMGGFNMNHALYSGGSRRKT